MYVVQVSLDPSKYSSKAEEASEEATMGWLNRIADEARADLVEKI